MANVKITELTAITAPATTDVLPIVDVTADTTKKVSVADLLESAGDGAAATPAFSFASDKNIGMYRVGADQLGFATAGVQALYINADGNILVADGNRMEIDEIRARDGAGLKLFDDAGSGIFVQDGGAVGIGTSDPAQSLDIYGSGTSTSQVAAITLRDGNSAFSRRWCISNGAGGNATDLFGKLVIGYGSTVSANPITGTAAVVIDSSGRVGIGTTSPGATLAVNGNINLADTGTGASFIYGIKGGNSFYIGVDNSTGSVFGSGTAYSPIIYTGAAAPITFSNSSTERARIDSSGRLLVGTSTSPSASNTSVVANGAALQKGYSSSPALSIGESVAIDIKTLVEPGYTYQVFAKINNGGGGTDGHLVAILTVVSASSIEGYLELSIGSGSGRSVVHSGNGVFTFASTTFSARAGILVTCLGGVFGT